MKYKVTVTDSNGNINTQTVGSAFELDFETSKPIGEGGKRRFSAKDSQGRLVWYVLLFEGETAEAEPIV